MLVPGAEPTGPTTGHVHPPDDDVLGADVANQVDGSVDEHPPEVGVVTLVEEVDAGRDGHLGPGLDQLAELGVAEPVEQ